MNPFPALARPTVLVVFGTRPDAIKMAPVIAELQAHPALATSVVVTAQHRSMLDQVLDVFGITPDYDLDVMRAGQSLADLTARTLTALDPLLEAERPSIVLVQGDTTTSFVAGLAAYYRRIPVGHVEAGLRTRNKFSPYPEEINRQLLGSLADLCFAPTATARDALRGEGVPSSRILITGNTVIDALLSVSRRRHEFRTPELRSIDLSAQYRTLLVTAHRRESFGSPLVNVCQALLDVVSARPDVQIVFPVHLNPNVRATVGSILNGVDRVHLIEPLGYLDFVHLMKRAEFVLTDSGGIQEEAPALGKPVLVMRDTTERPEAVAAGTSRLIGTNRQALVAAALRLLDDPEELGSMRRAVNPFGDGYAARRIGGALLHFFGLAPAPPAPFSPVRHVAAPEPSCAVETFAGANRCE